jgi:hypothetical protein
MALFDSTLLFYHATNSYSFTAGEFVSLVGATASSGSTVVNLGNARDLGIGPGAEIPTVVAVIGNGITSSSSTMTVNLQFQGSTDSTNWTTYSEIGALLAGTASTGGAAALGNLSAGAGFTFPVPRRTPGAALPLYYRLNTVIAGTGGVPTVSAGTILAGIVLAAAESAATMAQYPSGFSVA